MVLTATACESPVAPSACGPIPQVTVNVGETSSVAVCFDDANGDVLSYTAESSNPSVALASIVGTSITVSGVAPGNTSVTVTARDPEGLQGQQSFAVMVPNRAPQPRGTMPDTTVRVGTTATINASQYFSEPDGEILTYTATMSDTGVATVSVAGSTISMTAQAPGSASMTITASDPGGLSATQSFRLKATAPDLAWTDVSPTSWTGSAAGDTTVTLTFTLANIGGATAPPTTVRHYWSTDSTISTSDHEGAYHEKIDSLRAGYEIDLGVLWFWENQEPRDVYVGACVDPVLGESDTRNNCSRGIRLTLTAGSPDLAWTDVTPTSLTGSASGDTVQATFTLANLGSATAPSTTVRGYWSSDSTISTSDEEVGSSFEVGSLQAGYGIEIKDSWWWTNQDPGTAYIGLCVDPVPGESDTRNNCSRGVRLTLTAGSPDLAWTDVTPTSLTGSASGDTVQATFTLANLGSATAPSTTIRSYRSSNSTISTSDTELYSLPINSLRIRNVFEFEASWWWTNQDPGTIYIGACVDPVPGESDTRNNCSRGVRLTLTAGSPRSVTAPVPGDTVEGYLHASGIPGGRWVRPTTIRFHRLGLASVVSDRPDVGGVPVRESSASTLPP